MITWLIFPISAALLWAIVNYIDKLLLDKYCKNREVGSLLIFSGLIGAPVSIVVWLIYGSDFNFGINDLLITVIAGAIYIFALIPYMYALSESETSSTAPQMLMVSVFVALFGIFFLGEYINTIQLIGIILIIFGAIWLSKDGSESLFSLNKTFVLMAVSSFFLALYLFLFKFSSIELDFWETAFGVHIGFFLAAIALYTFKASYRKQFFHLIKTNSRAIISINVLSEFITVAGNLLFHYGSLLGLLAVVGVVAEGTQPLFVLLIGTFLSIYFPNLIQEKLDKNTLTRKFSSILIMVVGLVLVTTI